MKRIAWILLFYCLFASVAGQRNADYGVFGGVSSYSGDINPGAFMNSPRPAGGIFYRLNLNPREALRASLFFGGLAAADSNFTNSFQQTRAASFSGTVGELIVQFEFNFFPYSTQGKRWNYTPYLAGGAGVAFVNTVTSAFVPVVPFSSASKLIFIKMWDWKQNMVFVKLFMITLTAWKIRIFRPPLPSITMTGIHLPEFH